MPTTPGNERLIDAATPVEAAVAPSVPLLLWRM
jgi:hypothetical protein